MNRNILAQLMFTFFIFVFLVSASAEVIQLKDGRTLNGKIVNEDDQTIWVEVYFLNGKLVQKVLRSDVVSAESNNLEKNSPVQLIGVAPSQIVSESKPDNNFETQKYYLEKAGFSVEVPKEWKYLKNYDIFIIAPQNNHYGNFTLTVAIAITPASQNVSLEEMFQGLLTIYKKRGSIINKTGNSVINGINARWVKLYNDTGTTLFQYSILKKDWIYMIDCGVNKAPFIPENFDDIISKIKI